MIWLLMEYRELQTSYFKYVATLLTQWLPLPIILIGIYYGFIHGQTKSPKPLSKTQFIGSHAVSIHKTQILRCKISHRRLFPIHHAFTYSCLSVGIPVRSPSSTWILSVDTTNWWKRGWFHVTARDHLSRDSKAKTLSESLNEYIKVQGLDPDNFPHVYLLTTPRVLNYRFSPASFWYLYTADFILHHVIAEVNNTFGERRVYLFSTRENGHGENDNGMFKQSSVKDFHVSPFNSRKGIYQLSTASPQMTERVSVDVTLFSSKGHPKLVTRWWSDEQAIDPTDSSIPYLLWCLICWSWTILAIFPRIFFQASLLAKVRNLHIWYRPEPKETAIPRKATSCERFLASVFIEYLLFLVSTLPRSLDIMVRSPGAIHDRIISSKDGSAQLHQSQQAGYVEIRIHAPNFYRQLLSSGRLSTLLLHALRHPWEENRTVWSNDATLLLTLLQEAEDLRYRQVPEQPAKKNTIVALLLRMAWGAHRRLQSTQTMSAVYPSPGLPKGRNSTSRQSSQSADGPLQLGTQCFLHAYVDSHCTPLVQVQYMLTTLYLQWRTWMSAFLGGE